MKLFNIIATSVLGTAMAIGAGLALANKQEMKQARAAETLEATYDLSDSVPSNLTASATLTKDSTRGMGKSGTSYTLTTKLSFTDVSKVVVEAATNYGSYSNHKISITVGGNTFGSQQDFAQKALKEYSFTSSAATGAIVVSLYNAQEGTTSSNSIWVKTIKVYTGTSASVPEPTVDSKTIAEFKALPTSDEKKHAYIVTGKVKDFKDGAVTASKYGNITLTDDTNDLLVYGSTATANALLWDNASSYTFTNPQDFLTNGVTSGIQIGDTLEMKLVRADYKGAVQATGIILSVTPGETPDPTPEPAVVETNLAGFLADTTSGAYKVSYHFEATISAFKDGATKDQYGNMTLTDGVNNLKVYGSTVTASALVWDEIHAAYAFTNPQDFLTESATNNLELGDIVEVQFVRFMYNTTIEAQGIILGSTKPSTATSIQEIYTKASGAAVDFHGYYVGFSTGTGPIIMDGEYGIVIYDKTHDVSGYTPNVTKLHVVGALNVFEGLYEVNASTVEASSSTDISEPVTYTVTGSETYIHESRHTYVTGTVSSITVAEGKTKWSDDTTIYMNVNSKPVKCFVKAGGLDSTITDKIDAALLSSTSITLTGFTGWYDGFQVAVNGLFEASGTYTLNQFVTDFFDETNAICTTYEDGVSDYASFKTQLQAVWTDLNSETKYQDLSDTDKGLLRTTVASQEAGASDLQKALARYEFLVLKYKLGDFLERGLITSSNSISLIKNNSVTAIIIVTASIAVISLSGVFFIIRKRKHQ